MMQFEDNILHHHYQPTIFGLKNDRELSSIFINKFDSIYVDHHHHDDIIFKGEMEMEMEMEYSIFDIVGKDVPKRNDTATKKLRWLRSQIIGGAAEFETPFGLRHLTYADYTASGRSLHHVEDYIATKVLPFYGN